MPGLNDLKNGLPSFLNSTFIISSKKKTLEFTWLKNKWNECYITDFMKNFNFAGKVTDSDDCIEINGVMFQKPFVEKPVSAEDHNVYIYFPVSAGGGSQRLFRKVLGCSVFVFRDVICYPFCLENPVSAEEHNVYIYAPLWRRRGILLCTCRSVGLSVRQSVCWSPLTLCNW